MHQGLRSRLLLYYLIVMATISGTFGTGVYIVFRRALYKQIDKRLLTLAQSATPSFTEVKNRGDKYLNEVGEVPWRDIFNRDQQSLEWFDENGKLLGRKGLIQLGVPLEVGPQIVQQPETGEIFRTHTLSVQISNSGQAGPPSLVGFIRATQSSVEVEEAEEELSSILLTGGLLTLVLTGLGGFWLTQKAIEPIEASFLQLKQFTADASHELRSPLTAIKASVDVMRNHPERVHPKDEKKLEAIAGATLQMNQTLEDLLFLARTDADPSMPVEDRKLAPVSLNQILQNCFVLLESLASDKKIVFQSKFRDEIQILGDTAQLSRLFSNLLENALQYTPEEGRVSLDLYRQNRVAVISVRDTGIGLAPEEVSRVFDRFWRANKARSRRQGGSGLGLAISQAIAKRHRGKISVTSELNIGTCFFVRIPIWEKKKSIPSQGQAKAVK